jgi:hypothetical protein
MPKGKRETAAELMARLQRDPDWVRQNEEREARFKTLEARLAAEEEPILADLAGVGHTVRSIWDLVNSSAGYPAAIPVLCGHLRGSYHPRILEGIVRALTVREARGVAAREMLDELKRRGDEPASELRWALANALTITADRSMMEEITALLTDTRYEDVHERLRAALNNLRARRAHGI